MRVALIIASALALAVALVIAVGGDDEDEAVVETVTVTTPETTPTPDTVPATTPEEPVEPEEPADPDAPANGHGGEEAPRNCGRIAFNPSTDSGASGIEAVGTDCRTARAVARAARNAADELSYDAENFRCNGKPSDELALSAIEWICIGPDREVVNFLTT